MVSRPNNIHSLEFLQASTSVFLKEALRIVGLHLVQKREMPEGLSQRLANWMAV